MKLPEQLTIRVQANGKPVAGMFVVIRIMTTRKNNFGLGFGPTSAEGQLLITRDDLLLEADKDKRFFIMDYGHPEADFAGEIVVSPLNRDALQRAVEAYDLYKDAWSYPPDYLENIQRAQNILEQLRPIKLSVKVEHNGEGIVVRPETVDA